MLLLLAAALPVLFWAGPNTTAPLLRHAGMKLLRPPRPFSLHTSRHLMRLLGRSDDQWRKYLFYSE